MIARAVGLAVSGHFFRSPKPDLGECSQSRLHCKTPQGCDPNFSRILEQFIVVFREKWQILKYYFAYTGLHEKHTIRRGVAEPELIRASAPRRISQQSRESTRRAWISCLLLVGLVVALAWILKVAVGL